MRYVDFDSVSNYYERLVREQIMLEYSESAMAGQTGALEDIACLALNQLPPRYMRFAVDTSFYLTASELQQMHEEVCAAVKRAAEFVMSNPRKAGPEPLGRERKLTLATRED